MANALTLNTTNGTVPNSILRVRALELAVEARNAIWSDQETVDTAAAYYDFLTGTERPGNQVTVTVHDDVDADALAAIAARGLERKGRI